MRSLVLATVLWLIWSGLAPGARAADPVADRCGNEQVAKTDPDGLIAACTELLERGSREAIASRAAALNNRGSAYARKGDFDRALADCQEALRLDPTDATAYVIRGYISAAKGDLDRAIADYNEAIRRNPGQWEAFYNRGLAFRRRGEVDRAIADFDQAIRLEPREAEIYINRGKVFGYKRDFDRAIADFDEALRLDPQELDARWNRAHAYVLRGDVARGIAEAREVAARDPSKAKTVAEMLVERGKIYHSQKRYDLAIADLTEAIRLNPNEPSLYVLRGEVYEEMGPFSRNLGAADFAKAAELDPSNTELQARRAKTNCSWVPATDDKMRSLLCGIAGRR
jgi:tetratricopeptide (TPR) repeat protein